MGQQQQQQQSGDHSLAPVWIMLLLFMTGYFIWTLAHGAIVSFVFHLNILQATLVKLFVQDSKLDNCISLMQNLNPDAVEIKQVLYLTNYVGSYIRYPIIVILITLCVFLYKSDLTIKYKRRHNMSTLRMQEQKNWPCISPIITEDLVSMDINTGPWAMALSPMEFARKYDLLKKNDLLLDNSSIGQEWTAGLRRGDAKRIFTLQLGPSWNGFDNLPFHVKALAAVFLLRMHREKGEADKILRSLDKSFPTGTLKADGVSAALKKYQNTEEVQDIIGKHAYLLTVMASLLESARDDGVVPSSEFLWLKVTDRRLWYMLNCIGRQTPYSEVGGPFAHWKAEQAMERASRAPMIDEAIKALEIALREVKLTRKELLRLPS